MKGRVTECCTVTSYRFFFVEASTIGFAKITCEIVRALTPNSLFADQFFLWYLGSEPAKVEGGGCLKVVGGGGGTHGAGRRARNGDR